MPVLDIRMRRPRATPAILLATAVAVLANCGEHAGPTAPSEPSAPVAPSDAPAAVFIQSVVGIRELIAPNADAYHVSFELREIGGRTGAEIKAIDLTFSNGLSATFGPEAAATSRVGAAEKVAVSELSITGHPDARALSVQIRVLLTDDNGADSVSLAAASLTPAYALSGRITESATARAVAGAVVTVTFGRAAGRTTTADVDGRYVLRRIPVGPLSFTVSAPGFGTVTRTADIDANTVMDVSVSRTT